MKLTFTFIFLLFSQFTLASHFETFFTSIEGEWKLEKEVTVITAPSGEVTELSTISKFDATITRETYGWSLWEEYCVVTTDGEVCDDMWAIYVVDGEKLFLITEAGKREVTVLEDLPNKLVFQLGDAISHTESLSADSVLQKNIAKDETGSAMTQSLYLARVK